MREHTWIAVLGPRAERSARRAELREIPLAAAAAVEPATGDRVVILALPDALFVGAATAARVRPGGRPLAHLRDRIRAPEGHAVDPFALTPRPSCVAGWTRERLAGMSGSFLAIGERDASRIESALVASCHAFGPAPTRPSHAKPRTPGRRALVAGRAASGTLGAR